jgi:transcriptional regulator with XRE-family HTH domain
MSRILSGVQEPKLSLAFKLAEALGVTLDYLVSDSPDVGPTDQLVMVSEDEITILKLVRRLGTDVSMDRLLNVSATTAPLAVEERPISSPSAGRGRADPSRGEKA